MKALIAFLLGITVVHVDSAETVLFKINHARQVQPTYFIPHEYSAMIERVNLETGIPLWIVARIIEWESGWDRSMVNKSNANGSRDLGLMQLNSRYLDEFSCRFNSGKKIDPLDPEENVRVGMRYLARLRRNTSSWYEAVWAYNAGLSRVRRREMPPTTRAYLDFVFSDLIL
jgi:soluble lytic murein transglycosylase-like protein